MRVPAAASLRALSTPCAELYDVARVMPCAECEQRVRVSHIRGVRNALHYIALHYTRSLQITMHLYVNMLKSVQICLLVWPFVSLNFQ